MVVARSLLESRSTRRNRSSRFPCRVTEPSARHDQGAIAGEIPKPGYHPEGMYEFKIDLDGDAIKDVTRFTFDERDADGKQHCVVRRNRRCGGLDPHAWPTPYACTSARGRRPLAAGSPLSPPGENSIGTFGGIFSRCSHGDWIKWLARKVAERRRAENPYSGIVADGILEWRIGVHRPGRRALAHRAATIWFHRGKGSGPSWVVPSSSWAPGQDRPETSERARRSRRYSRPGPR
jgi:hypothetical protein